MLSLEEEIFSTGFIMVRKYKKINIVNSPLTNVHKSETFKDL